MSETYKKKNDDTLIITCIINETHVTEEDKAEIQTRLDHLEIDKTKMEIGYQKKIDVLKTKIAVLDEKEK